MMIRIQGENKIIIGKNLPCVFLGGTVAEYAWREELIELLDSSKISYFNPVVDDWDAKAQKEEIKQRETCEHVLYVITPSMEGVYSIAEVADDSNKRPKKTIFCWIDEADKKFEKGQVKSLNMVADMVTDNGATSYFSLRDVAAHLNK